MGRKKYNKKIKKSIPKKTREEREKDINKVKIQLTMLDLGTNIPGIKKAFEIFDDYIENGGYMMGKIKLNGCKRVLRYQLVTQPHIECSVMLEYNQDV